MVRVDAEPAPRTVLLVEDEAPNRALARAVLSRATEPDLRGITLAEAPVNTTQPCFFGSIRFTACCATRNPPKADTISAFSTSSGSS